MLTFAAAVFFLIITPGPGVMTTAGFGSAYGFRSSLRYVLGLFIGTNLVMLAVMTGLAAILLSISWLRVVLMVGSVAYLLYLAARIAFAGAKITFMEARTAPGILGGIHRGPIVQAHWCTNVRVQRGQSATGAQPCRPEGRPLAPGGARSGDGEAGTRRPRRWSSCPLEL
jgi:hypothetical protein